MPHHQSPRAIVSVLMPAYRQAAFIGRAIQSLKAQTFREWELIIIDDASPDETSAVIQPYLQDPRIRCFHLKENGGLGKALNYGLGKTGTPLVAYLPSDDNYFPGHLASLVAALQRQPDAVLAYSGVLHHYNRPATGQIPGYPLQLVQVMHRLTFEQWMERKELATDDLERMYWSKLRSYGDFTATDELSCQWTDHPLQRHKIFRETVGGGLNPYRSYYAVKEPLRFQSSVGNYSDEVTFYQPFRERPDTPFASHGLKILLAGELAYNPERVLALEEQGHKLYGLWTPDPTGFNTVGPLPFGHVEDIPRENRQQVIKKVRPDLIYALLNWQTVPFAHQVLQENPDIPFVWHFKEGPFICIEKGTWPLLMELFTRSDGQIYSSPEMREWFRLVLPASRTTPDLILDGDLPKREWFDGSPAPLLSETSGDIHTVVPGRPIGLHPPMVEELARQRIHLHFYGDFTHELWREWIRKVNQLAPDYLHLHSNVDQRYWVSEFSRYDAGWLHFFKSENKGELQRANWDDLNYPARISTLAAAGLPMLQYDNRNAAMAMCRLVEKHDMGLFFRDMTELGSLIRDKQRMTLLRAQVWREREKFSFDYHTGRLTAFFREVIASASKRGSRS